MVMGCQGNIHLFSGPGPQLRGVLARMAAAGGSEGREGEGARKHPAGAPLSTPGQRLPAPPWGPCQPGTRRGETQGVGLRSRGRWSPSCGGMETDVVELGNAGEGTWNSDFIHSLRQTFAWACQGAQQGAGSRWEPR